MFASATSGDRPNNSKFSSCSIGNISNVLDAIEDNKKRNCFTGKYFGKVRLIACINNIGSFSMFSPFFPKFYVTVGL